MSNIKDLKWHVNYARKTQIERLNEYLEDKENTIGNFLNDSSEWQLDSLIRYSLHYLPQIEKELEKKPNKLLFWNK